MLLFRGLKQNYPVYIFDNQEFTLIQGKAVEVGFPRLEMNPKTGKSEMVIDIAIEADGKKATYAIPESTSVTWAGNLVLSTDKQGLVSEVEASVERAKQIIAAAPKAQKVIDKASCLRAAYKVANDPDGYEGLVFCRWTADTIGKAIKIDREKFV